MYHIITNILITSFLTLLSAVVCQGQTNEEIDELQRVNQGSIESVYIDSAKVIHSEYDLLFGFLFTGYKRYVSSQDASSCSFTPTCSEYALIAIKREGIFEGLLNFWDRFSRCNGMNSAYYEIDYDKKLLIDPVRDWKYREK